VSGYDDSPLIVAKEGVSRGGHDILLFYSIYCLFFKDATPTVKSEGSSC
jgi:hypothetical protein